VHIFIEVFKQ